MSLRNRAVAVALTFACSACQPARRASLAPFVPAQQAQQAQQAHRARPASPASAAKSSSLARLQHDIDAVLAAPALDHAFWGVLVKSLATNETWYSQNAGKLMMPASTMKVVTLAAAADRLGWDFRYETRLLATGPVSDGALHGDLLVVGSGDPSIDDWDGAATRLFGDWADQLKASGVSTIEGRIVGDDHAFDDDRLWDPLESTCRHASLSIL